MFPALCTFYLPSNYLLGALKVPPRSRFCNLGDKSGFPLTLFFLSLWKLSGGTRARRLWLEKFPLCHSFSNGSAVYKCQSPHTPLTQRGSWLPGVLADAFPGVRQLGRRAQGSGESYPWWLLYAGRVTAPGPSPTNSRTVQSWVEGQVRRLQMCM